MSQPDLVAEHAALKREADNLRHQVMDEWETMPSQAARAADARLLKIMDRLAAIERTETWKYRTRETK